MSENQIKAKRIMRRCQKLAAEFWLFFDVNGIHHGEWCKFYNQIMAYGQKLKALETDWKPKSPRYPVEFRELLK